MNRLVNSCNCFSGNNLLPIDFVLVQFICRRPKTCNMQWSGIFEVLSLSLSLSFFLPLLFYFPFLIPGRDRTNYLLVKEAKIIAMTCTHAALKRRDLVELGFKASCGSGLLMPL